MTTFDLSREPVRELNQRLHQLPQGRWSILHPDGRHCIAVGVDAPLDLEVEGHVGYYCGGMNKQAHITINGSAGPGVAENMMSGSIRVRGNASHCAGASSHGGLLIVEGDASARCGISMKGSDIVVSGSIGHLSAFMAQTGRLVVCGDAGDFLGDSIYEAVIFVGGKVSTLGADCVEKEMTAVHLQSLTELLSAAGVAADTGSFRRYGSARKLYNFNIDHASDY